MNKFSAIISATLLSLNLMAQAPQKMSYQAVIRNSSDALVSNQQISMRVSILKDSENGTSVYSETHTATTNQNGLIAIAIGGGNLLSGDFSKINWESGIYFIKTETDIKGGTNYSVTGTSQMLSVPYALYALNSQPGPKGDRGDTGPVGPKGDTPLINLLVSETGDSLYTKNGNYVIIPGISAKNPKPKPISGYGANISDIDGNSYKTVYIGTQQWMAENLKVTKYNDGTIIQNITDGKIWSNLSIAAWCYYNNDTLNNIKYGKLYNWNVVNLTNNGNKNVCPVGWHVPTNTEANLLANYLGTYPENEYKIKDKKDWENCTVYNTFFTNSSLFSAKPAGYRYDSGSFESQGAVTYFLTKSEPANNNYSYHIIVGCSAFGGNYEAFKQWGSSVRCLKD